MDSTGLLRAIRRHARLLVVVLVAGVLLAAAAAALLPRTFTGRATLFLRVQSANTSLYQRSQFAMQRIQSYPQLLDAPEVLDAVITQTGLDETAPQLATHVSASATAGTLLLTVEATAPDAKQAADVTNAAASALAAHVNALENSQNTTKNAVTLIPQVAATAPTAPSTPDVPAIVGLGIIGGLAVGLLSALVLERFRPRIRDADDVRRLTGLPVVAQVPSTDRSTHGDPSMELAEPLRLLGRGRIAPVLLVLPAGHGVDAAGVARRLALGLTATGRRTLLVAMGTPSPDTPGLSELLAGTAGIAQVVRHDDDLDVVTAGDPAVTPSSFDLETAFPAVVSPLVADHDVSVLQTSTTDGGLDLAVVGRFARTALIVVSRRSSTERDVRLVLGALRALEVLPVGVILTDAPHLGADELAMTWQDGDFLRIELDDQAGSGRADAARIELPAGIVTTKR